MKDVAVRRLAAALSLSLTAALLAGCSSDSSSTDDESTSTDDGVLAGVTVEGDIGAQPTLTFDMPFEITEPAARVDLEGTGEAIEAGDVLSIDYVAVDGDDGTVVASTWESGTPEKITLDDGQTLEVLTEVFAGQKVGARVVFAAPGTAATETSEAAPAVVMAIEVVAVSDPPPPPLDRAEGEPVAAVDGLPVVTLAEDGAPSITVPEGYEAPAELVVQPLIAGTGPAVAAGDTVVFHYSGWLLDGTSFDSSWENGSPFTTQIGVGAVIPGWDEALVGQNIGSQLLLVIPSELAYGETGSGDAIPPNSPLIFVVDILGLA